MTEIFFAGAIIYNPKTKSLLLHHRDDKAPVNPDQWGFFGGTSENNETPQECLIRELKEELGVTVANSDIKPFTDYLNEKRGVWRYVFYIEAEFDKSNLTLGEGAGFDWVPLDKVFEYNLTDKTRIDLIRFVQTHAD